MPATPTGISLLSALRALGSAASLTDIPGAFFTEPEELAALHWMRAYVRQHHRFPGLLPFRIHCGFTAVICLEPLSYYRDRARQRALYKEITRRWNALKDTIVNKTPDETIRLARELVALEQQFGAWASEQTFAQTLDQVEAEFEDAQSQPSLRGIETGYEFLDDATGGWQSTDNIALVGRIGEGKSYLALKHAYAAWMANRKVLFQSNEMGTLQIARRMIGLHTRINPKSIALGRVATFNGQRMHDGIAALRNGVPFHCYAGSFASSTQKLRSLCEAHQPDIIIIDASYLLTPQTKSGSRRENLVEVANDLKKISIDFGRPLIHTVQFNREAVSSGSRSRARENENGSRRNDPIANLGLHKIAETDAIAANASIVLALARPRPPHHEHRRYYVILKGREGERGQWLIHYDFRTMNFDEVSAEQDGYDDFPDIEY